MKIIFINTIGLVAPFKRMQVSAFLKIDKYAWDNI